MLRALESFHKAGYCHKDIKPENFRVKDDTVYIIDFGISREYMDKGEHVPFATGRQIKGTPYTASIYAHLG